jgi:hypothetical protein
MSNAPGVTLPGGPPPGEPLSLEPVSGCGLEKFAEVSVDLAEAPARRREVLRHHGLTEPAWLAIEQAWSMRLATAALRNEQGLLAAHEQVVARFRAARSAPEPEVPLETCAVVLAAIERGSGVAAALSRARLSAAAWARAEIAVRLRAARDPAFAEALRAAIESEKQPREA